MLPLGNENAGGLSPPEVASLQASRALVLVPEAHSRQQIMMGQTSVVGPLAAAIRESQHGITSRPNDICQICVRLAQICRIGQIDIAFIVRSSGADQHHPHHFGSDWVQGKESA
jgi:hypothetical protein